MKRLDIPIIDFRDKLNKISPSFCAAKWQQVTLHLQTGHTHSCHHPPTHKIPLEELKKNPSALHNTEFKKEQRRLMLEGERPSECDYCWKIEDSAPDALSDRTYKSFTQWAQPYIKGITERPWHDDVVPSYLEISFSSVCNFKCSYCSAQVSSKWMEEIEKFGPYPTTTKFGNLEWLRITDAIPIPHREENPYVDAFWKWWPEIHDKLQHFRITGGEPLLAKDTFKVLDWYIENPNTDLELSINTNMCPPDGLLDKFIEKLKLLSQDKVKKINIFTSAEAHGKQAEYIRHGLDYNQWLANIRRILTEVPDVTFTIMSTYNIMSIHTYTDFLKDILQIKLDFSHSKSKWSPIIFDSPYLRYPPHQAIFIMPPEWAAKVAEQVKFVEDNAENYSSSVPYYGFTPWEVDRFKRMNDLVAGIEFLDFVTDDQLDFVRFVDEHDVRRGTNFLQTFPEFTETYNKWKAEL